jgi:hypothetical protein
MNSSDIFYKRLRLWKRQYLHVVIYTSLFWIFVDVFFIMLFSDCTKQVIIPCSASIKGNENVNPIDNDFRRHPKFDLNLIRERNETIVNRNNIINKKKTEQLKKSSGGFIAKWFGSDSGLKLIYMKKKRNLYLKGTNPSSWPGEGGRAVFIPPKLRDEAKKRFKENQFNIVASDLMALNRSINDQRSSRFV